jgi:hypothetical protein
LGRRLPLAIGIFVLSEGVITAYGRSWYGIEQAASSRYATASVIGVASLFVLAWRVYRSISLRILLAGLFAIPAVGAIRIYDLRQPHSTDSRR